MNYDRRACAVARFLKARPCRLCWLDWTLQKLPKSKVNNRSLQGLNGFSVSLLIFEKSPFFHFESIQFSRPWKFTLHKKCSRNFYVWHSWMKLTHFCSLLMSLTIYYKSFTSALYLKPENSWLVCPKKMEDPAYPILVKLENPLSFLVFLSGKWPFLVIEQ